MVSDLAESIWRALGRGRSRRATLAGLGVGITAGVVPRQSRAGKRQKCRRDRPSKKKVRRFIKRAAKKYHQDKKKMLKVAKCESGFDPCAYNPDGPWYGLYQYLKSTWKNTGYSVKDIYDPKKQALATARKWKHGEQHEWTCYTMLFGHK